MSGYGRGYGSSGRSGGHYRPSYGASPAYGYGGYDEDDNHEDDYGYDGAPVSSPSTNRRGSGRQTQASQGSRNPPGTTGIGSPRDSRRHLHMQSPQGAQHGDPHNMYGTHESRHPRPGTESHIDSYHERSRRAAHAASAQREAYQRASRVGQSVVDEEDRLRAEAERAEYEPMDPRILARFNDHRRDLNHPYEYDDGNSRSRSQSRRPASRQATAEPPAAVRANSSQQRRRSLADDYDPTEEWDPIEPVLPSRRN